MTLIRIYFQVFLFNLLFLYRYCDCVLYLFGQQKIDNNNNDNNNNNNNNNDNMLSSWHSCCQSTCVELTAGSDVTVSASKSMYSSSVVSIEIFPNNSWNSGIIPVLSQGCTRVCHRLVRVCQILGQDYTRVEFRELFRDYSRVVPLRDIVVLLFSREQLVQKTK